MAAVNVCSDFGAQGNKICHSFHFSPICHEMIGLEAILVFWMLSVKPAFSLSFFTLIKRLFAFCYNSCVICITEVVDIFPSDLDYRHSIRCNHCRWWLQPWNKRLLLLERKVMTNIDSILKSRGITLPTKVHLVKAIVFPLVMYGCESWTIKKAEHWRIDGYWTVVLEKTLENLLDFREIQPVHPKGNQSWMFIGRTDVEAETPILWPLDAKSWIILKDPDAGKDWREEETGMTEDEMVGWHHQLNGDEFG